MTKKSIECALCGLWVHAKCIPLSSSEIRQYGSCDELFMCARCVKTDENKINYEMLLDKPLIFG